MHKTDAAIQLIRNALTAGIKAGYVLMDTWFTTEPMLKNILDTGIHAIGMVKQLQQRYTYNGRQYTLPGLKKFVDFSSAGNIFGSLVVTTKTGIPVKIVFMRNRNKKSECLYLLSTDTSLNNAEIVRIYGNRWSIECFFKASKSFLKLGSEFQSRSYALQSLMALFVEHISTLSADITSVRKSKVTEWIASQAGFIQALLGSICWES